MQNQTQEVECLALCQSLETYWAYYYLSAGKLYAKVVRETANLFLESFAALPKDNEYYQKLIVILTKRTGIEHLDDLITHIQDWAKGTGDYPYESMNKSNTAMRILLAGVRLVLIYLLKIEKKPTVKFDDLEQDYSARVIRWQSHLPKTALRKDPDRNIKLASGSQTIAVIGDIRRSQDLMTYAPDAKSFSERMVHFITTTRQLVEKHTGFFDKFTGDGFIAYFNEAVCKIAAKDYIECFMGFIKDEKEFSVPFFEEWERLIRKRPAKEIGLAIGADIGKIFFEDVHDHLVAVGDAIVWGARMASTAESNEIIVNNLLFATLVGRPGIIFQEQEGRTKAGEEFLAYEIKFEQPQPGNT
jgi:class 3 adenylate cyclase